MKKNNVNQAIEILQAFREGKSIQTKPRDGARWLDILYTSEIIFNFERFVYRVKPSAPSHRVLKIEDADVFEVHQGSLEDCDLYLQKRRSIINLREGKDFYFEYVSFRYLSVYDPETATGPRGSAFVFFHIVELSII